MNAAKIALAPFLSSCPDVKTLGVKACLDDYSTDEKILLYKAERIFFPTPRFVDVFGAMEKPTFPTPTTYRYQRSRVLQEILFQYLNIPHPHSRIYFGSRQKMRILQEFQRPFWLMGPHLVPCSQYRIDISRDIESYLRRYNPIIARESVEWAERIQLICIQFECRAALRLGLEQAPSALSAEPLSLENPLLDGPLEMTRALALAAQLDDILIEWGYDGEKWQCIEFARPPVRWKTSKGWVGRFQTICNLIQTGVL